MDMKPVTSSNIETIGYDAASRTMRVQYKTGGAYDYADVSPERFASAIGAKSVGGYLHKHVRKKLKHTKVPT